jgi:uncharacterized membrane protein
MLLSPFRLLSPDVVLFALFLGVNSLRGVIGTACKLSPVYCGPSWLPAALVAAYLLGHVLAPRHWWVKAGIILAAILALVSVPTLANVQARTTTAPYRYTHDGLIQSEIAARLTLTGKNPYVESYANTPMAEWPFREGDLTVNPALEHYPYLPLTFLLPLPLQSWTESSGGWFDQRIVYLLLLGGTLAASTQLAQTANRRLLLLLMLGLNPLVGFYIIEGRNDVLVLFWIVLTLWALRAERPLASALFLALACVTKQLAWEFVPFWLLYVFGRSGRSGGAKGNVVAALLVFLTAFGIVVLPWLLSNPGAFVEDVIAFQSGMSPGGYPIRGVGFSGLLLRAGVFESNTAQFPFWLFQLGFGLPAFVLLLRWQARRNTLRRAALAYAVGLAVVLFFSRALNGNYVGYLSAITALGLLVEPPQPRLAHDTARAPAES